MWKWSWFNEGKKKKGERGQMASMPQIKREVERRRKG
jgi:hypothetical protein